MKNTACFLILISTVSLGIHSRVASAQDADKMAWSIIPYVWAPTTKLDLSFQDTDLGGGRISVDDLLDVLDAAFMVHVEGGRGNWSAFGDLTYLETSDKEKRPLLTIDIEGEQTFLDAAVAYWPDGVGSSLNVFGGVRYSSLEDQYRFNLGDSQLARRKSSEDYYDALLGLRYRFDLAERWSVLTRGDFSFGDSEGTFLVQTSVAYRVGARRQNRIIFGYQYKEAEYESGDLTTEYTYHGLVAGFNFRF